MCEDFEAADAILHGIDHTVGASEHLQLTTLTRDSHSLLFDEVYSRERSFAAHAWLKVAWCSPGRLRLASRDTIANALWDMGYDKGSHPNSALAGDTIFATSLVIDKRDRDNQTGIIRFKLVGVKHERPGTLMAAGVNLFNGEFEQKVFENRSCSQSAIRCPEHNAVLTWICVLSKRMAERTHA